MKSDNLLITCTGVIVLFVLAVIVSAVLNGWVLSIMWGWFVVPLFKVPSLSVTTAIGVSLVAGMLFKQGSQSDESKDKSTSGIVARVISLTVVPPFITLAFGYIVHLFL